MPGSQFGHVATGGSGACEADHAHVWISDQCLANVGSAREYMEHAWRQPNLLEDAGKGNSSADRGSRVGLQQDGVAKRESGSY